MKRSAVHRRWAGLAALLVLLGAQPATLCGLRCVLGGGTASPDAHGSAHVTAHVVPPGCHGPLVARRRAPMPPVTPTWLPGAGAWTIPAWVVDFRPMATGDAHPASALLDAESPPPRA